MDDVSDSATYPRNHEDAQVDALGRVVLSILFCGALGWLWYGVGKHLIWGSTKTGVSWLVLVIACLVLLLLSVKALTSLYIGCAGFLNRALYAAWQERRANQRALRQDLALQDAQQQIDRREEREARVLSKAWTMREQERMDKARKLATPKPAYRRCLPKNPRMRKRR